MKISRHQWVIGAAVLLGVFLLWSKPPPQHASGPSPAKQSQLLPTDDSTELNILDVAERTLDDKPALAVVVSTPLDAAKSLDSFFEVLIDQKRNYSPLPKQNAGNSPLKSNFNASVALTPCLRQVER